MRTLATSPNHYLRLGGVAYLVIIALGIFGELVVREHLIVPGDGLATLEHITARLGLWRAAVAGDLLMHLLDVPLIVLFYLLLRPVSRPLALLATGFNIVQTSILATNKIALLVPLWLATGDAQVAQMPPETAGALVALALSLHGYGFGIGLLFFGASSVVRGYLIRRSGYCPPLIGTLLIVAGVCYLINTVALLLAPSLAAAIFPWVLVPAFVGELTLAIWLIVRGVDMKAWEHRAAAA